MKIKDSEKPAPWSLIAERCSFEKYTEIAGCIQDVYCNLVPKLPLMQPIKIMFIRKIISTEQGGSKFEGVKEINEMFKQALSEAKGEDFLKYAMEKLYAKFSERITEGFKRDYETTGMRFKKITFQIDNLGYGRTKIGNAGDTIKYDVVSQASTVEYTCIYMDPEKKMYTCHTGVDSQLETFTNSGANPTVVGLE